MRSPHSKVTAIALAMALLGALLFPTPRRPAFAAPLCTLDRATHTTIDPSPFLSGGYNVPWNAATDRLAYMQTGASGFYRVFTMRAAGAPERSGEVGAVRLPSKRLM